MSIAETRLLTEISAWLGDYGLGIFLMPPSTALGFRDSIIPD